MREKVTERLVAGDSGKLAEDGAIRRAAELLRAGGTVAFPTETVYGLGANALDAAAVAKVFEAKQRPAWDPLIVHVSDRAMLEQVAEIPASVEGLLEAFWPGPMTLLLPKKAAVPDAVTAGRRLVGVRMPRHRVALALIAAAGVPIAAPSANLFGKTSPTTAEHVLSDLDGRIDAVLDGGSTSVDVESTVLDACVEPIVLYRPGAVTAEQIAEVTGRAVQVFERSAEAALPESLPSPGVGLRHYAPRARLLLVEGADVKELQQRLAELALSLRVEGKIGVMLPTGWSSGSDSTFAWGDWQDGESLARRLFAGMRYLDEEGVTVILCPMPTGGGIGAALRDRLGKAARVE